MGRRGHQRLVGGAAGDDERVGWRAPRPERAGRSAAAGGRPSRLGRIGPAAGAGRWSLVAPLLEPRPTDTASAHAAAMQLVERHGVVTREAVLAEGVVGGFASVYGVLKVLEERGQVRRGYFVSGLGAAQFAVPGAVDRLRSLRRTDDPASRRARRARRRCRAAEPLVLSATDPAQPYGATLPWPDSPGRPGPHRRRGGGDARGRAARVARPPIHHLVTFTARHDDELGRRALLALVRDGAMRAVEIRKINGATLSESPDAAWVPPAARAAGFTDSYRGLVFRRA